MSAADPKTSVRAAGECRWIPGLAFSILFACTGCASVLDRLEAKPDPADVEHDAPLGSEGCPYRSIAIEWPQSASSDPRRFGRYVESYTRELAELGFAVEAVADRAYWNGLVRVQRGMVHADDMVFAISVMPRRSQVFLPAGPERHFAVPRAEFVKDKGNDVEWGGAFLIGDWSGDRVDLWGRHYAAETARYIEAHTRRMCADWQSERHEEEARLDAIREKLVEEIDTIRRQRRLRGLEGQGKRLDIEALESVSP